MFVSVRSYLCYSFMPLATLGAFTIVIRLTAFGLVAVGRLSVLCLLLLCLV